MPVTKKTDNHYLIDKVMLRANNLPHTGKNKTIKVLDCFGGKGLVWAAVKKRTGRKIDRTVIDKRFDLVEFHLHGDNTKIMMGMDLGKYNVIDLDAYGIPVEQLSVVLKSGFSGVVFVTAIQTMQGGMPKQMLLDLGFPKEITVKAPSIPARRGWRLLKSWLAGKGVTEIVHRSKGRKHYFCFALNGAAFSVKY